MQHSSNRAMHEREAGVSVKAFLTVFLGREETGAEQHLKIELMTEFNKLMKVLANRLRVW